MKNVFGFNVDSDICEFDGNEFTFGKICPQYEKELSRENETIRKRLEKTVSPLRYIIILAMYVLSVVLTLVPSDIHSKPAFKALEVFVILLLFLFAAYVIYDFVELKGRIKSSKLRCDEITEKIKRETGIPQGTEKIHIVTAEYSKNEINHSVDDGEIFVSHGRINIFFCERVYSFPLRAIKSAKALSHNTDVSFSTREMKPDRDKCRKYGISRKGKSRYSMKLYRINISGTNESFELLLPPYEMKMFNGMRERCEMMSMSHSGNHMI